MQGYSLANRKLIFPQHMNPANMLFGGDLLAWIDEAAFLYAMEYMGTPRMVTKKISEVDFIAPARVGDIAQFWCRPKKEGNTSFTMEVVVDTVHVDTKVRREICRCEVVYVALDANGKPTPWNKI